MSQSGKGGWDLHHKWCLDLDGLTCFERLGQLDPCYIGVLGVIVPACFCTIYGEVEHFTLSTIGFRGEVEFFGSLAECLMAIGGMGIFESVWPDVHPDFGQFLRCVVGVIDGYIATDLMVFIIQGYVNGVINFLLEVATLGDGWQVGHH